MLRILEIGETSIALTHSELEDLEVLFKLRFAGQPVNQFGKAWLKPQGAVCKGTRGLGNACGKCAHCRADNTGRRSETPAPAQCKGSMALGSGCGTCEPCRAEIREGIPGDDKTLANCQDKFNNAAKFSGVFNAGGRD